MSSKADTSKEPTRALTPRLRFPEFQGAWEMRRLASMAEMITQKAGNKKYILMSITSGIGLISQMEKFGREIAGAAYKNYFVINKNDFAYNKSATKEYPEGFIALYSGTVGAAVPNSIFTCFRVQNSIVIPQYLNYLFLGNIHGKWLKNFISVGARAHGSLNIENKDLLLLPVPLPEGPTSLHEQQKIADCLSSIDELITAEVQKVEALKTHKKGLMQKLFPATGHTLPALRFPEFQDSGEWEEKGLADVGEIITGNTPSTTKPENYGGTWQFVSPADISDHRYIYKTRTTLTECGYKYTRHIKKNSILFVCIGSTIGKVAQNLQECATNQQINSIIPFSEYSNGFLYFYLQMNAKKIADIAGNQAVPIINKSLFSSIKLFLPKNEEQNKIADCLSSLDELITAQAQKVEALKTHKKGLMHQLFPTFTDAIER